MRRIKKCPECKKEMAYSQYSYSLFCPYCIKDSVPEKAVQNDSVPDDKKEGENGRVD